jgi:predicted Zn finger-like uncharacterized protein
MPETITCPECAKTLRVPDHLLGQTVRCPSCKVTFTAKGSKEPNPDLVFDDKPAPSGKKTKREDDSDEERPTRRRESRRDEAEDEEHVRERPRARRRDDDEKEDRPRRRRRDEEEEEEEDLGRRRRGFEDRGSKSDWLRVRQGIGLILGALFTVLGAVLFVCCGTFATIGIAGAAAKNAQSSAAVGGVGMLVVFGVYFLAVLAALALFIVGNCFCLRAPPRYGANTLAKVSLGLWVGAVLFAITGTTVNLAGQGMAAASPLSVGASGAGQVINLTGNLLSLAQHVVFLFFLRAVCQAIQDYRLAKQLVYLIVFFIASFVVTVVMAVVLVALAGWTVASTLAQNADTPGTSALAGIGIGFMVAVCFILLFAVINLIWFMIALAHVRGAIKTYLFRRAR